MAQVSATAPSTSAKRDPLDKFPPAVRDAHARFQATGDTAALDTVVLAIVHRHQPTDARAASPSALADSATFIGDLGFDSLALAEIVFFIEDLYGVSVSNQELVSITTVGELRAFVRAKITARTPTAPESVSEKC